MKASPRHIRRRRSSRSTDGSFFKRESVSEQVSAVDPGSTFFNPATAAIHRAAADPQEEKKLKRMPDKKEEEKKEIKKKPEQREEDQKLQKKEDKKEEEKKLQRKPDKKEEEKKVSRKEINAPADPSAGTTSYLNTIDGKGSALPESSKAFFEPRMGSDFSKVKIHTGPEAEASANEINARAYAYKDHIVFNKGQFDPETENGKKLLAHELTHVLQSGSTVKRRVSPTYPSIQSYLTRSITDWAVTDADEYSVISSFYTIRGAEPKRNFYDTIRHMHTTGDLATFFSEMPSGAAATHATLIGLIERIRDLRLSHEEQLAYQQSISWVTNGVQAVEAMGLLNVMSDADRAVCLSAIARPEFDAFLTHIPETNDRATLQAIQNFTILNQGTTISTLAGFQRLYLIAQAAAQGKTLEQFLAGEVSAHGYGGAAATNWSRMPAAQQARWRQRFTAIYALLQTSAIPEIITMINRAIARGGGIQFDEESIEQNHAFAYSDRSNWLTVGIRFVQAAEQELRLVYANISHEIGHDDYGDDQITAVMNEAVTPAEKAAAEASGNSLFSTYGYLETEMYAELREHQYVVTGRNPTDDPDVDVEAKLRRISTSMDPRVSGPLLIAFRNRISRDSNISIAARTLFDTKVRLVFPGLI